MISKRKQAKRPADPETLQKLLDQYEQVFGEVAHFIELIARQDAEIAEAQTATFEAKEKYESLKGELNQAREARDGSKHALFMFLKPGPAEILPLFDRMEPADEEKHGAHADQWRKEPISALRISSVATGLLTAADVMFVGQLQDRVQAQPADWWNSIEGLTAPIAAAIGDRINDCSGPLFGPNVRSFTVGSWCPTPDGSGKPEAVAMSIELDNGMSLVMRMKTPGRVDEIVQMLLRHKRDVWPDAP